MKGIHTTILLLAIFSLLGCQEQMTMKIYGDSPLFDEELSALHETCRALGVPILIASEYEMPNLVIVSGFDAIDDVSNLFGFALQTPDSIGWNVVEQTYENSRITFLIAIDEASTKKGIRVLNNKIKENGIVAFN